MANTKKPKKKKNNLYESRIFGGKIVFDPDMGKKRMSLNYPKDWQHFLNTNCQVGDNTFFYITTKKPRRTEQQNRYYHVYLELIALSTGYTIEELKNWVKQECLLQSETVVYGHQVKVVKSSANLTVIEFCEMLAWVEEQSGIPLPDTEPFLRALTLEEFAALKARERQIYSMLVCHELSTV